MLKRKKKSQPSPANNELGAQNHLCPENNSGQEPVLTEEYVKTLLSRVEDTAINIGVELAKKKLITATTTEEELTKISISALSPLALNVAEHVSALAQDANNQNIIDQMALEIIVNNHPVVALSAKLAQTATNSRLATKTTMASLQEEIKKTNPPISARVKIAGELSKNIVNSYSDTPKKMSPNKVQNSRNCVDMILPNPVLATSSTDPVILGIASIVAIDSAVQEAKQGLDYTKALEKIEHSNDIVSRFRVALSAQVVASDLALGQSPRTKKTHQIQQSLNLIHSEAPKVLSDSPICQVVAENLKPVVTQQPNPVLVDIYIKDELDVSEIPVDYAEKVLSNPQHFKNSDPMPINNSEKTDSQILQKPAKHNHTKRTIGVTATAATLATASMLNSGTVAQALPINPGSVAASLNLPKTNSAGVVQFSFNDVKNPQTNTSPTSDTQTSLGLEEGSLQPEPTSPGNNNLENPSTNTSEPDASLGIQPEEAPNADPIETNINAPDSAQAPTPPAETTQPSGDIITDETVITPPSTSPIQPQPTSETTEEVPTETTPTEPAQEPDPNTEDPIVSPETGGLIILDDIFSPSEPVNDDEVTPEQSPDQPQEPAVTIYPAIPSNESANEHIVIELNPASITNETAVSAPTATKQVETEQTAIILEDKSDAHKLSLTLVDEFSAANYSLSNNDINSYLEALTKNQLASMIGAINNTSLKKEAKTQVDEIIAYAKLISERPQALENPKLVAKIEQLIQKTPKAYKKQPALYALLLNNSQGDVATNAMYLNNATTSSPNADRYIKLLTTSAVANASPKPLAKLPNFEQHSAETPNNGSENTKKIEFHPNEEALRLAVDKYAQPDVKSDPAKLEYFKTLIVAIAKEAAKSHADVNLSVVAAQGALETGWGVHAHGNNLFGIKAGSNWDGPVFKGKTWEVIDGQRIDAELLFRAYDAPEGSVADRLKLVGPGHLNFENGCAETPDSYLRSLQHETSSGPKCKILVRGKLAYATDPSYETTIKSIIANNNIEQIFKEGGMGNYAQGIYAERQNQAERSNRGNEFGRKPEVTIPHGQKVAEQAREWVKNDPHCNFTDSDTCYQTCLNIVRKIWHNVTGNDGLKDYSAYEAYQRYKANGWVNKTEPIPVGAIMWSARKTGEKGWGHVYVYLGNGQAATNDADADAIQRDVYKIVDLTAENTVWSTHEWLGWSKYQG
jgi:flagellum-specific peptidoglycan hydrolase FlgJ